MPSSKSTESTAATTSSTGSDRVDGAGDGLRQRNTVNSATTPANTTQVGLSSFLGVYFVDFYFEHS